MPLRTDILTVDLQEVLERAGLVIDTAVIGNTRAIMLYRLFEDPLRLLDEQFSLPPRYLIGHPVWWYLTGVKDLIDVDITQPGDISLIEQEILDRGLFLAEQIAHIFNIELCREGLTAEFTEQSLMITVPDQGYTAESPRIIEEEFSTVGEMYYRPCMFG